jgi:hypothetical protein
MKIHILWSGDSEDRRPIGFYSSPEIAEKAKKKLKYTRYNIDGIDGPYEEEVDKEINIEHCYYMVYVEDCGRDIENISHDYGSAYIEEFIKTKDATLFEDIVYFETCPEIFECTYEFDTFLRKDIRVYYIRVSYDEDEKIMEKEVYDKIFLFKLCKEGL